MNRSNILARILDSERNFNGSVDPVITVDCGFIKFLGLDFRFWLLGRSDRGSQRSPGNFTLSLFCARYHAVEKMTRNREALELDMAISMLFFLVSVRLCFDTDVGYINYILLIVMLNAKTQYRAVNSRQFQQLKSFCISPII